MRKPTVKEVYVLHNCLDGLKRDIEALVAQGPNHDILGTMGTNLVVLHGIHKRMWEEDEVGAMFMNPHGVRRLGLSSKEEDDSTRKPEEG